VTLRTREGIETRLALSRYRIDDYIMEGWTRQALTRAVNVFINETMSHRANDNEPP
jgi:hypothetical protein